MIKPRCKLGLFYVSLLLYLAGKYVEGSEGCHTMMAIIAIIYNMHYDRASFFLGNTI